jgi:hypothetical protein
MVDRASGFVLPLMNHLVEERVQHLVPSMPAKVAPTDRDFAWSSLLRGRVVPKRLFIRRDTRTGTGFELPPKCSSLNRACHAVSARRVARPRRVRSRRIGPRRVDDVRDDARCARAPFGARSTFDERDDGLVHSIGASR